MSRSYNNRHTRVSNWELAQVIVNLRVNKPSPGNLQVYTVLYKLPHIIFQSFINGLNYTEKLRIVSLLVCTVNSALC